MAIARWSPFEELTNLHTTMDRLFGDIFDTNNQQQNNGRQNLMFRLPVDISETDNAYVIQAPVAGFKPEEVDVTITGNILTVKATRREERENKDGDYIRREMVYGDFMRQIALPSDAQADNVTARFENGVLRIEVPRTPRQQPKRVEVKADEQRQSRPQMAGSTASQSPSRQAQASESSQPSRQGQQSSQPSQSSQSNR